jgi:hypothetical protein
MFIVHDSFHIRDQTGGSGEVAQTERRTMGGFRGWVARDGGEMGAEALLWIGYMVDKKFNDVVWIKRRGRGRDGVLTSFLIRLWAG